MKRSPGSSRPCTRRWRLRSSSHKQTKSCRATSSSSRPWPRAASSRTPAERPSNAPKSSLTPPARQPPNTAKRQDLNLDECRKVTAAAWQMLAKAEWPLLKKANFSKRLGRGPSWELLFACSLFLFLLRASSPLFSVFRAQVFHRPRRGRRRAAGRLVPLPGARGRGRRG